MGFRLYSTATVACCFFSLNALDITDPFRTLSGHLSTLSGLIERREKERTERILSDVASRAKEAQSADKVAEEEKQKSEAQAETTARQKKSNVAVLVIDVQNDFLAPKGSLAVSGADANYVKGCKATIGAFRDEFHIIFTQDWHPKDHVSFASRWKTILDVKTFQPFALPRGFPGKPRVQMLWPDHCVQGTAGANVTDGLELEGDVSVKKGMRLNFDSYSGFQDDGGGLTAMESVLKTLGAEYLIVFGIATDYCVEATVLHALAWAQKGKKRGVYVIANLCRGVDPDKSFAALMKMSRKDARLCWLKTVASGPKEKALLEKLEAKGIEVFQRPRDVTAKLKALATSS